jgi:hypothetical protein
VLGRCAGQLSGNSLSDFPLEEAGILCLQGTGRLKITHKQVDVIERLTDLALRVLLFCFVLFGTAVLTFFFIYCVMKDKGVQAQAISGFGDILFFAAFGKLVWNFFVREKSGSQSKALPAPNPELLPDADLPKPK